MADTAIHLHLAHALAGMIHSLYAPHSLSVGKACRYRPQNAHCPGKTRIRADQELDHYLAHKSHSLRDRLRQYRQRTVCNGSIRLPRNSRIHSGKVRLLL